MKSLAALTIVICGTVVGAAAEPELLALDGDLAVHDPAVIEAGGQFYLFSTGGRRYRGILPVFTSPDLRLWTRAGSALEQLPKWVAEEVPRARTAWAPDIAFFNGKYHLYYSLSSFGVNDSAIGLATNTTLDSAKSEYRWVDQGLVVRSRAGKDDFNAIDPNVVVESPTSVWLGWGSFWNGIMMRRVEPATGKLSTADSKLHRLAARPNAADAIEAPYIVRRGDWWYLFVSWDYCCRGRRSDYKIVVGRSKVVTGPYVDKSGRSMTEGGGTLLIEAATDKWRGAGHPAVVQTDDTDYLVFHAYAADTGRSRLQISSLTWADGWPQASTLP